MGDRKISIGERLCEGNASVMKWDKKVGLMGVYCRDCNWVRTATGAAVFCALSRDCRVGKSIYIDCYLICHYLLCVVPAATAPL